jgi:hypothetical protein
MGDMNCPDTYDGNTSRAWEFFIAKLGDANPRSAIVFLLEIGRFSSSEYRITGKLETTAMI